MKLFMVTAKHYHSDDGWHDPAKDVRTLYVVHNSQREALSAARPLFGDAWRLTSTRGRKIVPGMRIIAI